MNRSLRGVLAAAFALLVLAAPAGATVPANAQWKEFYIADSTPYPVGQPTLHADLMYPEGVDLAKDKIPVILSIGPYFNHSGSTLAETPDGEGPQLRWQDLIQAPDAKRKINGGNLFARGYALLQVDLRGFGGSQGCNDFGGKGEQNDVFRAVEWAHSQPWASHIAIFGKSYDAWTAVMALNMKPRGLDAAIIQSPIIDGYRTLYQDGVHYYAGPTGWYATPAVYQADDAMPPALGDFQDGHTDYIAGWATGENPACYGLNILMQDGLQSHDDAAGFWKERDLPNARGSDVPVFWTHGFLDVNTKPNNFLPVWSTLKGPKHAWFGQFVHTRPNEPGVGRNAYFYDELFSFLDEYMKGAPHVDLPPVEVENSDGKWRSEPVFPPADGVQHAINLKAGSYDDQPNSTTGFWSITPALTHDAWISGVPNAHVNLTTTVPNAAMIVQLWDIAADGSASMVSHGAGVYTGMGAGTKTVELFPADYVVKTGHRLGVHISAAGDSMYLPTPSMQSVSVTGGTLTAPFLTYLRTSAQALPGSRSTDSATRSKMTVPVATLTSAATTWDEPAALTAQP